jgi:beta-lactamase class A
VDKISSLLFESPTKKLANIGEAVAQFRSLPGRVSLLVLEGNTVRARSNDQQSLAVASAFKLSVLDVLQEKIKAGKSSWQQVVPLQEKYKALPLSLPNPLPNYLLK